MVTNNLNAAEAGGRSHLENPVGTILLSLNVTVSTVLRRRQIHVCEDAEPRSNFQVPTIQMEYSALPSALLTNRISFMEYYMLKR
jgi:hypothetical protein